MSALINSLLVLYFLLLPFLFVFWIWMVVDAAKRDFENKTLWIVLLVLFSFITAIIYFFTVRRRLKALETKNAKTLSRNFKVKNKALAKGEPAKNRWFIVAWISLLAVWLSILSTFSGIISRLGSYLVVFFALLIILFGGVLTMISGFIALHKIWKNVSFFPKKAICLFCIITGILVLLAVVFLTILFYGRTSLI